MTTSAYTNPDSTFRAITAPRGFRAAGGTCGIKRSGAPDLALVVADDVCDAAAVFTRSRMPGAPIIVGKRHVRSGKLQAYVVNSGISNVCTGEQGVADAKKMCDAVSRACKGVKITDVLPSSTGIIGVPLPMDKILPGIESLVPTLSSGPEADAAAARAILTTDLVTKYATRKLTLGEKRVTIGAMAKGSGMIQPNMATMLVFITTDAAINAPQLQAALKDAVNVSFNRISVDHDTSTSDTVAIMASGQAGNRRICNKGKDYEAFSAALMDICRNLAYQVIRDGEGANKVFRVVVSGAKTQKDADRVGYAVVGSPLVKCAVHGGDANWGRLVMAVGRSGATVQPDRLAIKIGSHYVGKQGRPVPMTREQQKEVDQLMAAQDITFTIELGMGKAETDWLGCDLSREYVSINADYTT